MAFEGQLFLIIGSLGIGFTFSGGADCAVIGGKKKGDGCLYGPYVTSGGEEDLELIMNS